MSCKVCSFYKKNNFKTEEEFLNFRRMLNGFVSQNDILVVENREPIVGFSSSEFKCLHCGQYWKLVEPDHAFRGKWEKLSSLVVVRKTKNGR